MDELFTFNSQQLQTLTKRPSSTDNPPNIRKRIINSKFCKKQSLLSQASTRDDIATPSHEVKLSPYKKVTFNLDTPLQQDRANTAENRTFYKKAKSLNQNQLKDVIDELVQSKLNFGRYPLEEIGGKKEIRQLGKRTLSSALSSMNQSESPKDVRESRQDKGSVRQKRILSLKLNPKIVPISQRKLPKAFKIHFGAENNKRKTEKRQFADQLENGIISSKSQQQSSQHLQKNQGLSRLEKMLKMEAKLFEKLFKPAHS